MANTLKATILQIFPIEAITTSSGKSFSKRKIIFDATRYDQYTGEAYPNYPGIEFGGKAVEIIADLKLEPGDMVEATFVLDGRFYTKDGVEKHFTSIKGIGIARIEQHASDGITQGPVVKTQPTQEASTPEEPDDLPF